MDRGPRGGWSHLGNCGAYSTYLWLFKRTERIVDADDDDELAAAARCTLGPFPRHRRVQQYSEERFAIKVASALHTCATSFCRNFIYVEARSIK